MRSEQTTSHHPPSSRADYRWNVGALLTEIISFAVGFTLIDPSNILPAFVRRLTDSQVLIGLAGTIWTAGWTLPQVFSANLFGHDPRNKPYLRLSAIGRLLLWLIPIGLWLGLASRPALMLALFFLVLACRATLDGISAVSWFDFMAREIPANRRGRLQGVGQFVGGLASIGVGALVAWILIRYKFPTSYAFIFALGAAAFVPGGVAMLTLREHMPESAAQRAESMSRGGWFRPLVEDAVFRRLLLCRVLYGLLALASSFYVGHATDVLLLPEQVIGQFAVAQTLSKIVFGALFGLISDRWGPRLVIRLGILLTSLAPAFAFLVHLCSSPWLGRLYPLVFVALGISQGTYIIGFSNYVIEVAPEPLRPAYIGLGNSVSGLSSIWPLVGGWLLTTASYPLLFGLTAALTLLAFAFSLRLQRTASRQQEPLESCQRP